LPRSSLTVGTRASKPDCGCAIPDSPARVSGRNRGRFAISGVARRLELPRTAMPVASSNVPRILIADDQPDLIDALRLLLKSEGIHIEAVTSPDAALAALSTKRFDLLLMDLNY